MKFAPQAFQPLVIDKLIVRNFPYVPEGLWGYETKGDVKACALDAVALELLSRDVQGLLLGIGFAIVGMPAPVVFGVLAAVLSVVPFGGTALVWVPALATLLVQGSYGQAIGILVIGAIVSSVDNFLKPFLISGRSPLPTVAVFIGVLGGLAAFGLIGLFVGPVVIALVLALLEFAREQKQ